MGKRKEGFNTFLGRSCRFDGKLNFDGTVRLDGHFTGEIEGKSGTLIVGENGVVDASVLANVVLVSGEVKGDIKAEDRIEIHSPARVFGDIKAPVIVIDEGVVFEGSCVMKSPGGEERGPSHLAELPDEETGDNKKNKKKL